MNTPLIPPEEELRKLYAEQISNADVHAVSCWNESNHSTPSDDESYVAKALADGPSLMDKFDRIIDGI